MTIKNTLFELPKLGDTTRSKQFNADKEKLVCHPEVLPAFTAWNSIKKAQSPLNSIPADILESHIRTSSKIAITDEPTPEKSSKSLRNTFYFLNNFQLAQYTMMANIKKLPAERVININAEAIQYHAWFEAARLMFGPLDHRYGWVSYRDIINQSMPRYLIRQFFGQDQISVEMLLKWSGMDMRAYERMRAAYRKDNPQTKKS